LYWAKSGAFYAVDPLLEGVAFVDGVPRGASPLRLLSGPDGGFFEGDAKLAKAKPLDIDAVIVCCHGGPGEDGTIQGALSLAGISFSGPSVAGASLGMDKLAFGTLVADAGLPHLPRVHLDANVEALSFSGPYIVKPRFGGSSIGIDVVADVATAKARLSANPHLSLGAVVEPYRSDLFDLQIGIRTYPKVSLSAIEKPLRSKPTGEILDYADKYVGGEGMASAPRELPAMISASLRSGIEEAARTLVSRACVRGVARLDVLSDGTDFYINEINTIPGSLGRYLWIDPAVSFLELLDDLVGEAKKDMPRWSSAGADSTILRGASAIAAKLA
jgi:D-alanine-D-alanine ligase